MKMKYKIERENNITTYFIDLLNNRRKNDLTKTPTAKRGWHNHTQHPSHRAEHTQKSAWEVASSKYQYLRKKQKITAVLGISYVKRKLLQFETWRQRGGYHLWYKSRNTRKKKAVRRDDDDNKGNNNKNISDYVSKTYKHISQLNTQHWGSLTYELVCLLSVTGGKATPKTCRMQFTWTTTSLNVHWGTSHFTWHVLVLRISTRDLLATVRPATHRYTSSTSPTVMS